MAEYTLLLLAPNRPDRARQVGARVRERAALLGLSEGALAVRGPTDFDPAAPGPAAAVYFGGPERAPAATALAARFVAEGRPVLPVVPTLDGYQDQVPTALHGVNGLADDGADGALDEIVNRILVALGLVRDRRRVFISYKRDESTGVARQLAAALPAAGWSVFLDTQSVERGRMFQHVLWDALADTDLVVFLDTPSALQSRWVAQEFAQAGELGVTLLQLVWPGRGRAREAELSEVIALQPADFLRGAPHDRRGGRLRQPVVRRVVETLERLRAEAFAARRRRLVESFVRRVRRLEAAVHLQPAGHIQVVRRTGTAAVVVPVVGAPESLHFEDAHRNHGPGPVDLRILYHGLGLHPSRVRHLEWLDAHLPVKLLALSAVTKWVGST